MTQQEIEQYKAVLARYLAPQAVDPIFDFLNENKVHFRITQERKSKLGDYSWPRAGHPYNEITVNGNLNQEFFLWVLLHECAHLNCHKYYGLSVKPHGHEWQQEYQHLLLNHLQLFPEGFRQEISKFASRIPLSNMLMRQIESKLRRIGQASGEEELVLDDLAPGTYFGIVGKEQMQFKAVEKRRTRWACINLRDGQKYLVSGTAPVFIINK